MNVLDWFAAVLSAVLDMSTLRVSSALEPDPAFSRLSVAIGVALMAALSTMVGHGVIFMLNRVRGVRFVAGMGLGAAYLLLLHVITGLGVGLVAVLIVGEVPATTIAVVYLLSLAPQTLGFLVFVPHFGLGIGRLIEGWCLLTLLLTLIHVLQVGRWQGLLVGGTAWLFTQVLSRMLARPVASLASLAWTRVTGSPTFLTAHDVMAGAPFVPLDSSTPGMLR